MKVLFVSSLYHPYTGGAERIVGAIAEGLVKAGHEAVVICNGRESESTTHDVNGVTVYNLRLRNLYWPFDGYRPASIVRALWYAIDAYNPLAARAVGRVLDIEKPSLVNTHTLQGFSGLVWREVKRRHLPLVHTLHDYWLLCGNASLCARGVMCEAPCLTCRVYTAPRRRLSSLVDAVSSAGNFILQRHLGDSLFSDAAPKRWIHNASTISTKTRKSGRSPNVLQLGYLGRIDKVKGVDLLLRTLTELSANCDLLVGGYGHHEYVESLKQEFGSSRVRFLGSVRPEEILSRVDVLVVPSIWHDPLPTVIFEAYAHGVPVIGSRRGGIPEIIDENRTGFIFSPEVPGSLKEQIRRFVDDPSLASKMRSFCLAKARHYTVDRLVAEYLSIYSELVSENSVSASSTVN